MAKNTNKKQPVFPTGCVFRKSDKSVYMANHRKACRVYPAGHHQLTVFLRLIRLIVAVFNQIRPNLSRKKL
jgi:hypothetical protein